MNRTEKRAAKTRITEKALDRLEVAAKPWESWDLQLELIPASRSGDSVARLAEAVLERGSFRLGSLNLEITWAERVAIVGPNGSGKTTLLRVLLGNVPLSSGQRWLGPGVVVGELDQGRGTFAGENRWSKPSPGRRACWRGPAGRCWPSSASTGTTERSSS